MTLGTFRDQLIYPDTVQDMKRKHIRDSDLETIIEQVGFSNEGFFYTVIDILIVLSGVCLSL